MKIPNATLAWDRVTNDGYAKLDLKCVVFDNKTILVKRLTPGEQHAGNFVVFLDADRISEDHHANRLAAVAEAERYVYDQPQFASSQSGAIVKLAITLGRQAYLDGQSIYTNPYAEGVDREQWVQGWLEAFGRVSAERLFAAAEATARANLQLDSDNKYLTGAVRAYRLAINFAFNQVRDVKWKPRAALDFLVEWMTSNDADAINAKYPDWKDYVANDPNSVKSEPSTN